MTSQYQVQEFAAGKWWPLRSFDVESEALEFARAVPKARVKKILK